MGQIVFNGQKPKYCNLTAITTGSKKDYLIPDGEIWLIDSTNTSKTDGTGKYDYYIKGDGSNTASQLAANKIKVDDSIDISGKADKSEMSVVAGTGANADKTTITLKSGTSATVLTQHQDVSGKEDKSNKVTSFSSPTDTQYPSAKLVSDQLATKQGTISDLSTIRSGASAGATAYQKPGTGIPKTDLASAVQTSLGKADTAIQSVTVGTTTTGAAGTNASVVNGGTATAPVLNFTIPQGAQGVKGDTVIMGGESSYTLYNTTGDAVDGAMTQQAVTRELTELGGYTTSEEWIKVVTDTNDKILYGVRADGEFVFGVGVPQSIKDYVLIHKAEVDAAVSALNTAINNEVRRATTAEGTKVDKVAGKGLSANDYTNTDKEIVSTGEIVSNDEYIQVVTDVDGRVLEGVKPSGDKKVFGNIKAKSFSTDVMNLEHEPDDNYIIIVKDYFNRFLYGVKKDGSFDFADGVPEPIRKYIAENINAIKEDSISGVVARNRDKESSLYAACRYGTTSPSSRPKDFQICMVTDTHTAENEQSITNAVACTNGFRSIDALIHLGDIEMFAPRDTYNTPSYANGGLQRMISEKMAKCVKPWFVICGNHEVGASCTLIHYTRTHKEVYDDIIKPVIENGWLKAGEYNDTAANYADRCYYFHDFDKTKVRLICLYEYGYPLELRENSYWEPVTYDSTLGLIQPNTTYTYDANNPIKLNCGGYTGHSFRLKATVKTTNMPHTNSGADGGTFPWYKARGARIFTKTQMDWLVATLNSTPAGYGVVIASHQPILRSVNLLDKKFSVGGSPYNTYNPRVNGPAIDDYMDKDIIADIVNAWQNMNANFSEKVGVRTDHTLIRNNADYLNTLVDGDYHYYYEVVADFSERNNTAYFAGYISGHEHFDMVEQSKQYPTQFNVIPCCSGAAFRAKNDTANLVYDTDSVAYDNLTTFSCASGRIALARIGNTKTINGIDRDLEIINTNNN